MSRGCRGQAGIRKAAWEAGLSQDTDSVWKILCPLAPPSMLSFAGNMILLHDMHKPFSASPGASLTCGAKQGGYSGRENPLV